MRLFKHKWQHVLDAAGDICACALVTTCSVIALVYLALYVMAIPAFR